MEGDVARGVPSLNIAGAQAFHNALDENLVSATTGQKSAEQAMKDTAAEWKKIIKKKGGDKLVGAIQRYQASWPDLVDKA
jgi:multiple sugar transport system substrate-binding protein